MRNALNVTLLVILIGVSAGVYRGLLPGEVTMPQVPAAAPAPPDAAPRPPERPPVDHYWALAGKNLFHPDRRTEAEQSDEPTQSEETTAVEPPNVTLLGVIIAGGYKVALIQDPRAKTQGVGRYRVGGDIQEFSIVDILPDRVVMRKGNGMAEVELNVPRDTTVTKTPPPGRGGAPAKGGPVNPPRGRAPGAGSAAGGASSVAPGGADAESIKGKPAGGRAGSLGASTGAGGRSSVSGSGSEDRSSGELPAPFQAIFGNSGGSPVSGRR